MFFTFSMVQKKWSDGEDEPTKYSPISSIWNTDTE